MGVRPQWRLTSKKHGRDMRLVVLSASDRTARGRVDECNVLNTATLEIGGYFLPQCDNRSAVEAVPRKIFQSLGVDLKRSRRVAEQIHIQLLRRIEADGAECFVERFLQTGGRGSSRHPLPWRVVSAAPQRTESGSARVQGLRPEKRPATLRRKRQFWGASLNALGQRWPQSSSPHAAQPCLPAFASKPRDHHPAHGDNIALDVVGAPFRRAMTLTGTALRLHDAVRSCSVRGIHTHGMGPGANGDDRHFELRQRGRSLQQNSRRCPPLDHQYQDPGR